MRITAIRIVLENGVQRRSAIKPSTGSSGNKGNFDSLLYVFGQTTDYLGRDLTTELYQLLTLNVPKILVFFDDATWLGWLQAWINLYTNQILQPVSTSTNHRNYAKDVKAKILHVYATDEFQLNQETVQIMTGFEQKLRNLWEPDPILRRVLLFSLLWPNQDDFIRSHCSSPGSRAIDDIRDNLADVHEVLITDDSGNAHYEVEPDYVPFANNLLEETFGQKPDQLKKWMMDRFNDNQEWVNTSLRDTVLRFFCDPFVPNAVCSEEYRHGGMHSSTYLIEYLRDSISWRIMLIFLPYCWKCGQEPYIADHVMARASSLNMATDVSSDMRFVVASFLPDPTLYELEKEAKRRIHCFDILSTAYMERYVVSGKLKPEDADRIGTLAERHRSGLFNLGQRWSQKVLKR